MSKKNPDIVKRNAAGVSDSAVKEVIIEDEAPQTEVFTENIDELEWGDLSEFGPVLPLGTDMLRNKPVYRVLKRFFDIVLSVFALVVLSPLLLLVALAIFIDDPHGSPIFIQEREGQKRFISIGFKEHAFLRYMRDGCRSRFFAETFFV